MERTLLNNLVKALEYENMLISGILTLGQEKTACLVGNKPLKLAELTPKEQSMAEQLGQLEKVRMMLNQKAAVVLEITGSDPTISDICAKLSAEEAKPLREMQGKLQTSMKELLERNRLNAELLKQSLDFVNFNIQLLAKPSASVPRYGRGGKDLSDNAPHRSIMDLRS